MQKILIILFIVGILIIAFRESKREQTHSASSEAKSKVVEPTYSTNRVLPSEVFGQHKKSVTQTNNTEKK